MSSKHLSRAAAATPDDHCCSCGAGIFDEVFVKDILDFAHCSLFEDADFSMQVCGRCEQLEMALIQATGKRENPERIAAYRRMQERF